MTRSWLIAGSVLFLAACAAPVTPAVPTAVPTPRVYVPLAGPDYGLHVFVWGHPDTTARDLRMTSEAGFHWQKSLFQWRQIEGACKGCFDWTEADRIVQASAAAGLKVIARVDFQPDWARAVPVHNGPPDIDKDYADFVGALVARYAPGSKYGSVDAVEIWNEVNLDREWGNETIDRQAAADYVRLLSAAYVAAKAANPAITVITAGLSPTGVSNGKSVDDIEYLQWLYDAGLKGGTNYDVLGANANAQAPDATSAPGSVKEFGHPSFYFRRVEQLRAVQVKNGDAARQIWLVEFGWTSDTVHPQYQWFAVSEQKKAINVVAALKYAREQWASWMGVMTVWTLPDPAWTAEREEFWWAIANPDGTPRDAYKRLKEARSSGALP